METPLETVVREEVRRGNFLWLGAYLLVPVLLTFIVGYDQGHILEAGMGMESGVNRLHELSHDMRHAAGFMCH